MAVLATHHLHSVGAARVLENALEEGASSFLGADSPEGSYENLPSEEPDDSRRMKEDVNCGDHPLHRSIHRTSKNPRTTNNAMTAPSPNPRQNGSVRRFMARRYPARCAHTSGSCVPRGSHLPWRRVVGSCARRRVHILRTCACAASSGDPIP